MIILHGESKAEKEARFQEMIGLRNEVGMPNFVWALIPQISSTRIFHYTRASPDPYEAGFWESSEIRNLVIFLILGPACNYFGFFFLRRFQNMNSDTKLTATDGTS